MDAREKWHEAQRQILAALDIQAEYAALGVRFPSGAKARPSGWMPCHAIGREDKNPSAEINVGDGPARGRYRDFGGDGQTLSLFDFAATRGQYGGQWKEARKAYARKAHVRLPQSAEELPADRFDFFDVTAGMLVNYASQKPGIAPEALVEAGVRGARWPKNLPAELAQYLLAFPMFGGGLLDLEPIGWHTVNSTGKRIRKFKGKGVEPELVKTLTHGSPGLMNVDALRRLPKARVVWIVEGISDMLALHSSIPAELRDEHVVVSAGGCTYHPQPEWLPHFAGKEIRVCFDNDHQITETGEVRNPGQLGAKIWVGALVGVAAVVRNVLLEIPGVDLTTAEATDKATAGQKMDLRDWLGEGRVYRDLCELAETFPPVQSEDKESQLEPHQAVLSTLGCLVLGQVEGTEAVEIFSQQTRKTTQIKDLDKLSYAKLILALGGEIVEERITESREPQPDRFTVADVRNAIAREASRRFISGKNPVGAGVWPVPGGLVLVGSRSADLWNGRQELERVTEPIFRGQRLDFGCAEDWYDRELLGRYLADAKDVGWRTAVVEELLTLFQQWDNWSHPGNSILATGLTLATWIQTTWPLRPLVAVIGPTDCGKTMLLQDTIPKLFGSLGLFMQKPSEAGLRQDVGTTAKVLSIDEFEDDKHRRQCLELLRTSSRGGEIPRGSSGQRRAIKFGLKHIVWMGAINFSLNEAADRNRFVFLELDEVPKGRPPQLKIPSPEVLQKLGLKCLACALVTHHAAHELAARLAKSKTGLDSRISGIHAVPIAAYHAALGSGFEAAAEELQYVLSNKQVEDRGESDQMELVRAILESLVPLPGGRKETVSTLLTRQPVMLDDGHGWSDSHDELTAYGIRLLKHDKKLFLVRGPIANQLLKGTHWASMDLNQVLLRVRGAERDCRRMPHAARGISIPLESIRDVLPSDLDY